MIQKKKKKSKQKFKASLLGKNPDIKPEALMKKRISFLNTISMPVFKTTEVDWIRLFQNKKDEKLPINRDLVGAKNYSDFLGSRISEIPKIPDLKGRTNYSDNFSLKKKKDLSENLNWLIIEPTFREPSKENSIIQSSGSWLPPKPHKRYSNTDIRLNTFNFDTRVIPQRQSNCVTVDEIVNYLKFKDRLVFK